MEYSDVSVQWNGQVSEIELSEKVRIGGEKAFSYYFFDGPCPNKPIVALEVNDVYPDSWSPLLRDSLGESILKDSSAWAKRAVEEFQGDMVFFDMVGTHQDKQAITPDQAAHNVNQVLAAVDVPVIVRAAGSFANQNQVITQCAQAATRKVILGSALQENYRTITAAALASGHWLLAESPIDVNIAKQLNILITQMNFPIDKIIIDPLTGGLGYGLEYTYSVMERIRLQTFNEDPMMVSPILCCVGQEVWRIKEIKLESSSMGDHLQRAINWEVITALSLILAGANILVVRHPESVKRIKSFINALFSRN